MSFGEVFGPDASDSRGYQKSVGMREFTPSSFVLVEFAGSLYRLNTLSGETCCIRQGEDSQWTKVKEASVSK